MKRIGLTGCGSIGHLHANNLKGRAELLFYNRTSERAAEFARKFGGQPCSTYEELLEKVDGVVIATPPECHETETIAALAAGVTVMVEKPLCTNREQLARIAAVAAQYPDTVLMVAENYYYKPSLLKLKQHIASGILGGVERIEVKKLKTQRTSGWRAMHGALIEGGIHFVALAADLLDVATSEAVGHHQLKQTDFPNRTSGQIERNSVLHLAGGGSTATIHYAWDVPSLTRGLLQHSYIVGEEGCIIFESNGLYLRLKTHQKRHLEFPGFADMMGYRRMTSDFVRCLDEPGHQPYSNLERATRDLEIVFAAYQSMEG